MDYERRRRRSSASKKILKDLALTCGGVGVLLFAVFVIWVATLPLPDFNNFENRSVSNSTKIYDRTGKTVLYNVHDGIRRTEVSIDEMSPYVKQATVAIEDAHFYEHHGFRPTSFIRALLANVQSGGFSQGGSTITQQVVKNALLTREKTITRKLKEIILAIKLDKDLPKDAILQIYLNESPYGGTLYGIEEASLSFFDKHAKDLTLVESAYLAALPQSPTFYSPFGKNRDALEKRKNLVLERMYELSYITEEEKTVAQTTVTTFERDASSSGKALHFVMYVREYLEEKYGVEVVQNGGLKVITTIDYPLQKEFEEMVKKNALDNSARFSAKNAALVAIDPRTGQIISMVGSRDFFDKEIPGQYNIALATRQPGSSFKPIVYAEAFELGYTPETVLFDAETQFSSLCDAYGNPRPGAKESACYMPVNYDGKFRGPISLREALAQSLNVPAVKTLYLVGLDKAITLAQNMGLSTINDPARYGLSLVLGGGEVSLLELTNAYGVFANNGIYSKPYGILEVRAADGTLLEKNNPVQKEVLSENTASLMSSVLSDNVARAPVFGASSALYFGERPVAVKTGTTNDYRDTWVMGYTPSVVIGMWAGNNDNSPLDQKAASQVLAPTWHKALLAAVGTSSIEYFPAPLPNTKQKPILQGNYCSSPLTTILAQVVKSDPDGPYPSSPQDDSQYERWNTAIIDWVNKNGNPCVSGPSTSTQP